MHETLLTVIFAWVNLNDDLAMGMPPLNVPVQDFECPEPQILILGWCHIDELIFPVWFAGKQVQGIATCYPRVCIEVRTLKVFPNRFYRSRIQLIEMGETGSSAQRFYADAACSGVKVEEIRSVDVAADYVEEGLLDFVHDGTSAVAGHLLQLHTARFSGDNA